MIYMYKQSVSKMQIYNVCVFHEYYLKDFFQKNFWTVRTVMGTGLIYSILSIYIYDDMMSLYRYEHT